jgi:prefoldin subunit 5
MKICNGEVVMLQKELDAITATLQQLENQKEQAQKCLDELDEKVRTGRDHCHPTATGESERTGSEMSG